MAPIYLFGLASKQSQWLSVRQSTIAQNVANANTPGYTAKDVVPFQDVLDDTASLQMTTTNSDHMDVTDAADPQLGIDPEDSWEVSLSGNSVSLDEEMAKSGEVNGDYSLNMGIVKAFQDMLLASVKD